MTAPIDVGAHHVGSHDLEFHGDVNVLSLILCVTCIEVLRSRAGLGYIE